LLPKTDLHRERAAFHGSNVSTPTDVGVSALADALSVSATGSPRVEVDCGPRGGWTVTWPGHSSNATYRTLNQALRAARTRASVAPFSDPVQLIVRDAYHRVVHREVMDSDHDPVIRRRPHGHEPDPTESQRRFTARWPGDHREQKGSLAA
jgi:hypothetical protein